MWGKTGAVTGSMLLVAAGLAVVCRLPAEDARPSPARPKTAGIALPALKPGDINTEFSRVYIFVDKTGFGHQHAVEGRIKEGALQVAAQPAGIIIFDMQSFTADTEDARRYLNLPGKTDASTRQQVTENMLGRDVLDAKRFPLATFVVESLKRVNTTTPPASAQYELVGDLTVRGVSRKIKLLAEGSQEQAGYLHLRGKFPLRQTQFGIQPFQKAFGTIGVADVLLVYGDLWIVIPREEKR
jgi:hypothetical protein